jgi:hypothetical protein
MGASAERLAAQQRGRYGAGGKTGLTTNAKEFNAQTVKIAKRLTRLTGEFTKARKRQVARAGASPIRKVARRTVKRGKRIHYRYDPKKAEGAPRAEQGERENDQIIYHPGNLRKSIKTMTFKRSTDAFVGPKGYKGAKAGDVFGLTAKKVDGYYAAMAYGTESGFNRRILAKAKAQAGATSYKKMAEKTKEIADKYYKRKGLKL